eukprot:364271-Chlamydomonas_euryale.AAC.2
MTGCSAPSSSTWARTTRERKGGAHVWAEAPGHARGAACVVGAPGHAKGACTEGCAHVDLGKWACQGCAPGWVWIFTASR